MKDNNLNAAVKSDLFYAIRDTFYTHDPIGICRDTDNYGDEYDSEIDGLLDGLFLCETEEEIQSLLYTVCLKSFNPGMSKKPDEYSDFAKDVKAVQEEYDYRIGKFIMPSDDEINDALETRFPYFCDEDTVIMYYYNSSSPGICGGGQGLFRFAWDYNTMVRFCRRILPFVFSREKDLVFWEDKWPKISRLACKVVAGKRELQSLFDYINSVKEFGVYIRWAGTPQELHQNLNKGFGPEVLEMIGLLDENYKQTPKTISLEKLIRFFNQSF